MDNLRARYGRVVIDLGTGDGRAVLERARREPDTLVIGVDASHAAMAGSSRRATTSRRRGALANALFVAASAEHPPDELIGIAAELTITFPWGSLLAGALATDPVAAGGIASLIATDGCVRILVSVVDDDRLAITALDADDAAVMADRWASHGLRLMSFRLARTDEVRGSGSSWARRLAAGLRRRVWQIDLVKEAPRGTTGRLTGRPGLGKLP